MRVSTHACATPEGDVDVIILGSGGGAPSPTRETSCVLVRDGDSATIWAPGQWLYDTDSAALPASLLLTARINRSHGPPTDSHPAYIRHLALLI